MRPVRTGIAVSDAREPVRTGFRSNTRQRRKDSCRDCRWRQERWSLFAIFAWANSHGERVRSQIHGGLRDQCFECGRMIGRKNRQPQKDSARLQRGVDARPGFFHRFEFRVENSRWQSAPSQCGRADRRLPRRCADDPLFPLEPDPGAVRRARRRSPQDAPARPPGPSSGARASPLACGHDRRLRKTPRDSEVP